MPTAWSRWTTDASWNRGRTRNCWRPVGSTRACMPCSSATREPGRGLPAAEVGSSGRVVGRGGQREVVAVEEIALVQAAGEGGHSEQEQDQQGLLHGDLQ